jgi:hydroxymethylbilane synthase
MLPAMNQGILCAQFRAKDDLIIKTIQKLSSNVLKTIFKVERAVANALEGDCNSAISIFANTDNHLNNKIKLHTRVMSVPLAKQIHHSTLIDSSDDNISKNFDAVINELISLGAKDLV